MGKFLTLAVGAECFGLFSLKASVKQEEQK